MQIGTFQRNTTREGFSGIVRTFTVERSLCLEPVTADGDKVPDFRIYASGFEVGIAYRKTSQKGNEYISILLDDPAFAKPIWCNLLLSGRDELPLLWDRPKSKAA